MKIFLKNTLSIRFLHILFITSTLMIPETSFAQDAINFPSIIDDHMVLQRESLVPIWGWDKPGTKVSIHFRDHEVIGKAGDDGRFEILVATGSAGGPYQLRVTGSSTRTFLDILVGEVWIAGGQSNMWWPLKNCTNGDNVIASSHQAQLRWFDANTSPKESGWPAEVPQRSVDGQWEISRPEVAGSFAGTAYFFALKLQRTLKIPVGIVNVSVPGTAIELWMRPGLLKSQFPDVVELHQLRQQTYEDRVKAWKVECQNWEKAKAEASLEQQKVLKKPTEPLNPNTILGGLWNGMVAPVLPFGAKGFIWWQGEANSDRTSDYRVRFPALIEDWRRQWRLPQAPWIFVELANFGERYGSMMEDAPWPALRDAQKSALSYSEVYRVSAIDILEKPTWEIHPPNKAQTGHRLFLAALANVYGHRSTAWSGPDVQAIEFEASQCLVTLKDSKGLRTRDGKNVRGFVLAGSDRNWHPAEATIRGHQIVVKCKEVLQPVAVRYAWMNNPDVNLENEAGLPAWPFRSDCWNLGE